VSCENPQISTPTIGNPNNPKLNIVGMEYQRSSHVATLSPIQCAVWAPDQEKVEWVSMNGILFNAKFNAMFFMIAFDIPYRL
jgi:hypothetical protein